MPEKAEESRLKALKAKGEPIFFPPNPAKYLTDWLFEIGPASGEGPISWSDMAAWERTCGITLFPWEATTLRALSAAYLAERTRAHKPDALPPWSEVPLAAVRERVDRQFAAMFNALKARADAAQR